MHYPRNFTSAFVALGLLVGLGAPAAAQDASIVFTKTVGTNPAECATSRFLPEVPDNEIVYYCYEVEHTGSITATAHSLVDSELGAILGAIPGGRCCTDSSGSDCADPVDKCSPGFCGGVTYTVCAPTTFPGVCCSDPEGTSCSIPHEGCIADDDCNNGSDYCVTNPVLGPGTHSFTRVITATIPAEGVFNSATVDVASGICCTDSSSNCDGEQADFCTSNADCTGGATCETEGLGRCCDPNDPGSCGEEVCLIDRGCDDASSPFSECVELGETATSADASAQVGVLATPAASAFGVGLLILGLTALALRRLHSADSLD